MSAIIRVIFLWCFFCPFVHAQEKLIQPYIEAWKVSDTSQTHRAEDTYAVLKHTREAAERFFVTQPLKYRHEMDSLVIRHKQIVQAFNAWLAKYPDDRLKVRVWMYDILGRIEYKQPISIVDKKLIFKAIGIAHRLKDDQLKAELYAFYGQLLINNQADPLLYNLKAVELQRKIGFQHFSYVQNRFFNISYNLYHTDDFKESINYGKECLKFKHVEVKRWDPRVYLFQLDIIGASYLKLGKYDSTVYYYKLLIDTLTKKPDKELFMQRLWLSIARGNIGNALILEGKEVEGLPLVKEQLRVGLETGSFNNAAIAQNVLADVDYRHLHYKSAQIQWTAALNNAVKANFPEQQLVALKGIAESYLKLQQPDSFFVYYQRYNRLKDIRTNSVNARKLSILQSKIAFDNLQNNLNEINYKLNREKLIRDIILAGVVVLSAFVLLFYSRNNIKAKYRYEQKVKEQREMERQAVQAREQVMSFSRDIVEKDRLIYSLNKALRSRSGTAEDIAGSLTNYLITTDQEWARFREMITNAYPGFFMRLETLIAHVTPAEERLASLICLQLSDRQMANMLGISKDSVARSKRRLKKRIAIPHGQTLEDLICGLSH